MQRLLARLRCRKVDPARIFVNQGVPEVGMRVAKVLRERLLRYPPPAVE